MTEYFKKIVPEGYEHQVTTYLHDDHMRFLATLSGKKSVALRDAVNIAMKTIERNKRIKRNRVKRG